MHSANMVIGNGLNMGSSGIGGELIRKPITLAQGGVGAGYGASVAEEPPSWVYINGLGERETESITE